MTNLAATLQKLSPEQRQLFLRRLNKSAKQSEGTVEITSGLSQRPITPVPRDGELQLSFAQERLWFLDQLEGGSATNTVPAFLLLRGRLDVPALIRSLHEVIRRHEVLRTTFRAQAGRPVQVVAEHLRPPLPLIDLSSLEGARRESEKARLLVASRRGFDLSRGPLIRVSLLRLAPTEHLFIATIHHIVYDGWSTGVFDHELVSLYRAFSTGRPSPLARLAVQYADYAHWQRHWLRGEVLEAQLDHWRRRLGGELPQIDLPVDRPRPVNQSFHGEFEEAVLSQDLSARLRELGRAQGMTLFMTMLAAFVVLMGRQSGQRDVIVGTPTSGRVRPEIEGLVGCFLNILALRVDLSGNPSFREFLGRVRREALGAYAHQDLPFERLLEDIRPQRDLSRTPVFQVFFNMLNFPSSAVELPELTMEYVHSPETPANFDLTIYVVDLPTGIDLSLVYNDDLFDKPRMHEMLEQYQVLLAQLARQGETAIDRFSLLTPAARAILVSPVAVSEASWPGSVPQLVARHAAETPAQIAVEDPRESWTYRDLIQQSGRLAAHLAARGIGLGDVVAVYAHRSAPLAWSLLGVLETGAAFVMLDPAYPAARQAEILRQAGPAAWLGHAAAGKPPAEVAALVSRLPSHRQIVIPRRDELAGALAETVRSEAPGVSITPDTPAYLAFTSGTTARPKGIRGGHRALSHFLAWQARTFGLGSGDRFSLLSGLAHDPLLRDLFTPLTSGATLCVPDPEALASPGWLARWMARQRLSVTHLTPAMAQLLAQWESVGGSESCDGGPAEVSLSELRYAFFGGDVLSWHDVVKVRDLAPNVTCVNFYGATETPQAMGFRIVAGHETGGGESVPLGRGIEGAELLVLGRGHDLAGIGELGEIHVRTTYLSHGYLARAALEAERFTPDPFGDGGRLYRTGDLGRYLPDGNVAFHGRADRQVQIRGFRVEPGEVEALLEQHPAIRNAAVVARGDEASSRQLVAYVVAAPGAEDDDAILRVRELRGWLGTRLPDYMLPAIFLFLEALPLTPNGKLDVKALPAPENSGVRAGREYEAPRTPIEKLLAEIFSELLGVEQVGIYDGFFELGGHSLLALQLLVRMRETLAVELPLRRLFETQTIAALAATLTELSPHGEESPDATAGSVMAALAELPRIAPDRENRYQPYPLTDLQQAYWLGHTDAFELGNVSAHQYREFELTGLDLERLEEAWQKLVELHDVLRLTIRDDGQQQVLPEVGKYRIEVDDLRRQEADVVEEKLMAVRERMADVGPSLDGWPLFELRASRLGDDRIRLHLSTSLLISDGLGALILARDLFRLYHDETRSLPRLELSHRDYVLALATLRESELYRQALGYWRRRLTTLPPAPELPLARSPATLAYPRFERRRAHVPARDWQRLRTRARDAGVSPTALLCTLYAEVLATWSKGRHFTLNLLFVNRLPLHSEVQEVAGNFSSTLPVEVNLAGRETLVENARRLQAQLFRDLDHSLVTGVEIAREMHRLQGASGRSILPVVFTSTLNLAARIGAEPQTAEEAGSTLRIRLAHATLQTPQVWLDHQVLEIEGELVLNWDAVEDLFPPGMVDEMFDAYRGLIARLAAADSELWNHAVPGLVPAGQFALRAELNATGDPRNQPPGLLHNRFQEAVRNGPQRPAVISAERTLSYRELQDLARLVGRRLRESGARPGQLVAVVMDKGWEQLVAVLAVLEAGAAYLPIDPALPAARIDHLLERGQVATALCQPWIDESLHWPSQVRQLVIDEALLAQSREAGEEPLASAQAADDLAYVIFTSGSTGLPKGVMIEHRAAVNTVVDVNDRFAVGPQDRVLALSSLSFDLSVWDVFGLLGAGGAVVLPEPTALREPVRWLEWIRQAEVTIWNTVPALMEMLVDTLEGRGEQLPPGLRVVMMSGDWIPVTLPGRIRAVAPGEIEVMSLGGATEASIWSIWHPIGEVDPTWASIPYGRPMSHQRFHVLDENLEPKPTWTPGQLYIAGTGLARGYWRDEATTRGSFFDHPRTGERLYRTGDLGRYLPAGNIEFLGREDFQVKIQGYRIELGEIEATLLQHPAVRAAVVVVVGKESGQRRLGGYVVPEPEQILDVPEIDAFLRHELPEYMVPRHLRVLESLPLSANGKVDRQALPSMDETDAQHGVVPPRDDMELEVAKIWEEVLGTDSVSVTADFFELGGSSLMAVRLMARIQQQFQRDLPLSVLFESATVEHLASVLRSTTETPERRALVAIEAGGSKRPFFCVHPVGGSVICYVDLARCLDPDRPFFGLQLPDTPRLVTIEDMAAHYFEVLREVQPEGPYLLGGWSMGGWVAFEIARLAARQGQAVDALLLLDTQIPDGSQSDMAALVAWFARDLAGLVGRKSNLTGEELRPLGENDRLERLREWAVGMGVLPPEVDLAQVRALFEVFACNARALVAYRPEPQPISLTCYRTQDGNEPARVWSELATGEVESADLNGNHFTMLQPPHVAALGERLRTRLDRADAQSARKAAEAPTGGTRRRTATNDEILVRS